MKKQFVTYEIALKLKELGFSVPCFSAYTENGNLMDIGDYSNDDKIGELDGHSYYISCLSPLWQQCVDWFREKYNLLIDSPKLDEWNIGKWSVKITSLDNSIVLEKYVGQPYWRIYRCFRIYEEARESAILKCIELLN